MVCLGHGLGLLGESLRRLLTVWSPERGRLDERSWSSLVLHMEAHKLYNTLSCFPSLSYFFIFLLDVYVLIDNPIYGKEKAGEDEVI